MKNNVVSCRFRSEIFVSLGLGSVYVLLITCHLDYWLIAKQITWDTESSGLPITDAYGGLVPGVVWDPAAELRLLTRSLDSFVAGLSASEAFSCSGWQCLNKFTSLDPTCSQGILMVGILCFRKVWIITITRICTRECLNF